MGLLGKLFNKGAVQIGLTDWGKKKHDNYGEDGLRMDILVYLNDNGSASTREMAENIPADEGKVKACVETMRREGLVELRSKTQ